VQEQLGLKLEPAKSPLMFSSSITSSIPLRTSRCRRREIRQRRESGPVSRIAQQRFGCGEDVSCGDFTVSRIIPIRGLGVAAIAALSCGVGVTLRATQAPRVNENGRDLFKIYCASCHGATGQGNGPVAAVLRQPPSDLTQFTIRNGGTFPAVKLYRIIDGRDIVAHGNPEMPVWGNAFTTSADHTDEETVRARIDAIVLFLETIQAD
jgi:mono/diheme cytochrome c family protein